MPRTPPAKLVEHVVAACGLSLTAREVAGELDFDGEDGEIAEYQLECAGLEFARVVRLLHGWDALDDTAMAARAAKVFARCSKPDLHEDTDGWVRFGRLLEDSCSRGQKAIAAAKSVGFRQKDMVSGVLSNAVAAVFCTVHLVDPSFLRRWAAQADPGEKARLAGLRETIELDIEANRALIRLRVP